MSKSIAATLLERVLGKPASKSSDPARDALERDKLKQELRKLTAEADMAEQERGLRLEAQATRKDTRRVVNFNDGVGSVSVAICKEKLAHLVTLDPKAPIEIVFNSPGGSVIDGFDLYDTILQLRSSGTPINTTILGMGASMGGVLSQAGGIRRIGPHGLLMIHEVANFTVGKLSTLKDDVKLSERLYDKLITILAKRSTLTVEEIKEKANRQDWWCDSEEALRYGFVDEVLPSVLTPKAAPSLSASLKPALTSSN